MYGTEVLTELSKTVTMTVIRQLVFVIILTSILIGPICVHSFSHVSQTLETQLNREERKAECCAKKMRCCKKHPPPPDVEIRAVIARCIDAPNVCGRNRNMKKPINSGNINNLQKFQGFDEDEPLIQSEVTKCAKKLILTIKMKNEGETNTRPQYIIIDHVYDPLSDQSVRLMNPYVIKMRQEHLSQAYGLKFLDFVNSQAKEQVYNKHDGNYTGCCMEGKKPTCGLVTYEGMPVPYSGGFCCSCDAQKNAERQPQNEPNPVVAYSDPAYLLDAVQCPRTRLEPKKKVKLKGRKKQKGKDQHKRNIYNNNIYYIDPKIRYRDIKEKNKGVNNNFGMENNYKIQTMNDEYEDQLTSNMNFQTQFYEENANLKGLQNEKKYAHKTKSIDTHNEKNFFENNREHTITNLKANSKQQTKKPSMHKLLNLNTAYSPSGIYDVKTSVDKAYQDVGTLQHSNKDKRNLKQGVEPSQENSEFNYPEYVYGKRQVQSSGIQRRGGQNCADRYTPPHLNPETYHESTHCLRFSPVWYGVYKLNKPVVEQETIFQVFEKYETESGAVKWKDLTKGKKVKLGTFWPYYKDEVPTISMTFNSVFDDQDFCLDWNRLRLLIPEGVDVSDLNKYPEARAGPSEYLMVPTEKIIMTGDQCNVAGVGFEAFFKQPNRCSMPRGTCLQHQPYHLWHYDKMMERNGKRGCFFLKHHGKLATNPIRKNSTTNEKFLSLNYYGRIVSMVDMEINADFNAILKSTSTAVITEIYIDSTYSSKTSVTIKVSNAGMLSSKFMVRICDCPLDLQGKLDDVKSDLVVIPPQHQHIFKLSFQSILSADIFHCSVEALNPEGELVALRRIKIQKLDRCICTWHCLCACIGSSSGLKCIPMTIDHYHAAGFKGGLPIISYVNHETLTNDVYRLILFIISFIFFTLFILGLTKAILGLCCLPIGIWGLNVLLDLPKPMNKYYDKNLMGRMVVYNESGWPIHPDSGENVRNIPVTAEFCTNVLFFYSYPTVIFLTVLKRVCCPFYSYEKVRKKPKSKKRSQWFQKHKCNLRTCFHKEAQTDDTGDASSNTSDKKKKKKSGSLEPTDKKIPEKKSKKGTKKSPTGSGEKPKKKTKSSESSPKGSSEKVSKKGGGKTSSSSDKSKSPKKKSDSKKKPAVKVSIKEKPEKKSSKSETKNPTRTSTPKKKRSTEFNDNPYYYSSSDDGTTYSSSTASNRSRLTSSNTSFR